MDKKMIRSIIRMVLVVMALGYALLWIMMPTNTYGLKWSPRLNAKVSNSTYFGSQGYAILLYTFPVLLCASLGCVYLHLGNNLNSSVHNNHERLKKHKGLGIWKRPILVKGPLGIVSSIEIGFLVMFIALLVWSFSVYMHNSLPQFTPESAAQKGAKVWEVKLEYAAFWLGVVGNIGLVALFFPVARSSSVLPLLGLTSEASIKYHIWLGHIVMALFTAHGLGYILFWALTHNLSEILKWDTVGISNVAGEISLLGGFALWVTTVPGVRRKMFELFFYTHYLYIVFVVFFVFHVGISYASMMLPGFYLFIVDRFLRFLQSRKNIRLISARILPCETLELIFSKNPGLKYHPLSSIFINVPIISKLQWHPFTMSSSSNLESETLSVIIKSEGSWTKKLYQMLSSPDSSADRLEVAVEGPYGPVSTDFLRHDTLVMVSGGSGIAPFISIIRELIFAKTTLNSKTPRLLLIAAFKKFEDLSMLELVLPLTCTPSNLSELDLKIEAYVTKDKQPKSESTKTTVTKWFKPHVNDSPISTILGPNSWLWLGAIIVSSFAIFLILIAIVTCYYIYPIDHNTNDVFSASLRAFLNMLMICFSIALTAGFAVYWNKKENAKEAKQIQNLDGSPMASPTLHNVDRELESLPQQALEQAINVHYGDRPDLKKILFDCKGSSIGVLACGPRQLRHDVARICSSGLAENLHFESISFSW